MGKKLTTEEFIERARKIHGDKYDYSLVTYISTHSNVKIICKEHGIFEQTPGNHLQGSRCKKCFGPLDKEEFIKRSIKIHGDKYDYSKVNYTGIYNNITIICKKHGEFQQIPNCHLNGKGCSKCRNEKLRNERKFSYEKAIEKMNKVHNNRYQYPYFNINNLHDNIKIICPVHGEVIQEANSHLRGVGCPFCSLEIQSLKQRKPLQQFITEANSVHYNRYNYSLVEYKNGGTKVKIICPVHGFFPQTPNSHLHGEGCPKCKFFSKGEDRIKEYLTNNNFNYIEEHRLCGCKYKYRLPFDFAIFENEEKTKLKCLIEYDGEQHFAPIKHFGGEKTFMLTQTKDNIKNEYCKNNNIKLIRIPYWDFDNIDIILNKELLNE